MRFYSSFTIPCTIGDKFFGKALCDLGASINLMPLSIYSQLGLPEVKPTNVTLQLADRSLTYPWGKVEDILVKVDKFSFPADFIVLDFEEDKEISLILGRLFLATGRTLIDAQKGELTMRVQDQEVTFNVFKAMQFPKEAEDCLRIDWVESAVNEFSEGNVYGDPLETTLVSSHATIYPDALEYLNMLNASPSFIPHGKRFEALDRAEKANSQAKTSIEEPPVLELKQLPSHLRYAYLGDSSTLPIIISASLDEGTRRSY